MSDLEVTDIHLGLKLKNSDGRRGQIIMEQAQEYLVLFDNGDIEWGFYGDICGSQVCGMDTSSLNQRGWARFLDDYNRNGFEAGGVYRYYGSVPGKVLVKNNDGEIVLMAQHLFSLCPVLDENKPRWELKGETARHDPSILPSLQRI